MLAEMASNLVILKWFSIIELMAGEMIHIIMLAEMACNLLILKWFSIIQFMVEEIDDPYDHDGSILLSY